MLLLCVVPGWRICVDGGCCWLRCCRCVLLLDVDVSCCFVGCLRFVGVAFCLICVVCCLLCAVVRCWSLLPCVV